MLIVFFGYFSARNYYLRGEQQVNKEKNNNINCVILEKWFSTSKQSQSGKYSKNTNVTLRCSIIKDQNIE